MPLKSCYHGCPNLEGNQNSSDIAKSLCYVHMHGIPEKQRNYLAMAL